MLITFFIYIYVIALVGLANREQARQTSRVWTDLLTLGLTRFDGLWAAVGKALGRLRLFDQPAFDARQPVHRVAALLLLFMQLWLGGQLFYSGGLADNIAIDIERELANGLFMLLLALLGLGYGSRRSLRACARRLGLRRPNQEDWLTGLAMALALYLLAAGATALWQRAVPPALFEAQTSAAWQIFADLQAAYPAGFLLALLVAIPEEILFRGALQPVFGILLAALVFSATHLQYGLTPAWLILFAVALGFGWLRWRVSTSAAIIAHAAYNALPFLLAGIAA